MLWGREGSPLPEQTCLAGLCSYGSFSGGQALLQCRKQAACPLEVGVIFTEAAMAMADMQTGVQRLQKSEAQPMLPTQLAVCVVGAPGMVWEGGKVLWSCGLVPLTVQALQAGQQCGCGGHTLLLQGHVAHPVERFPSHANA